MLLTALLFTSGEDGGVQNQKEEIDAPQDAKNPMQQQEDQLEQGQKMQTIPCSSRMLSLNKYIALGDVLRITGLPIDNNSVIVDESAITVDLLCIDKLGKKDALINHQVALKRSFTSIICVEKTTLYDLGALIKGRPKNSYPFRDWEEGIKSSSSLKAYKKNMTEKKLVRKKEHVEDWIKRWDYLYDAEDIPGTSPTQVQEDVGVDEQQDDEGTLPTLEQEDDISGTPTQEQDDVEYGGLQQDNAYDAYILGTLPTQEEDVRDDEQQDHASAPSQEHDHAGAST
ncbi:hypothetical protein V6N11_035364 [Hibiscus sabdariffa]|uniref:Uncharacterized protein n=1 Tax=Hibiscus sabdariffa TaxID=183260 RepID=A0ABR2R0U9_9ROSI